METPDEIIQWLIESDPWTRYQTSKNLLHEKLTSVSDKKYKQDILSNSKIKCLIDDANTYFPQIATWHTDSKLSHYKLRMLSDFGLSKNDGMEEVIKKAESHQNGNLYSILDTQIELLEEKGDTLIGWFYNLPFVNGQFKKEQIGCPMAGMAALEVFSLNDDLKESKYSQNAYKKQYG